MRALILEADPEMIEERKWKKPSNAMAGVPVWSHDGIVCTGETYTKVVKLTFARGASLPDPSRLFNASLEGNTRRAIDIHEGEKVDARAFKALVKAAVAQNGAPAKKRGSNASGHQERLPRRLTRFQRAMSRGGIRQAERAANPHAQRAGANPAKELVGARQQLVARRHVVTERRAGEEERSLAIEDLRIDGRHRAARGAEEHHHPAGRETLEALVEGGPPHRIVDHLQPAATRQALHLGDEILLGVENDVAGSRLAGEHRLLRGRCRADHRRADARGDLAEQEPDASGRRMHETPSPRASV